MSIQQKLHIKVDGIILDLFENAESDFFINKVAHELSNLETREADSTSQISLPATIKNLKILGLELPEFGHSDPASYKLIKAEVLMNGIPVIPDAEIMVNETSVVNNIKTISITLFGGAVQFFESLSTLPISSLDWSDYDMSWTLANLEAIANTTEGICYADATWYTNKSIQLIYSMIEGNDPDHKVNTPKINISGFFVYMKTILLKILATIPQLTFDYTQLFETSFSQMAIAAPMNQMFDEYKEPSGYFAYVKTTGFSVPAWSNSFRIGFAEIIIDESLLWDTVNNQFVAQVNDTIDIEVLLNDTQLVGYYPESAGQNNEFRIVHNVNTVAVVSLTDNEQTVVISNILSAVIDVIIGDTIHFEANAGNTYAGFPKMSVNANFNLRKSLSGAGDYVFISDWLPNITQKDFVKEVFKMFNIVPIEYNNHVLFDFWENISYREKQDLSKNFDLSQPYAMQGVLQDYAIKNRFHYLDNEDVSRSDGEDFVKVAASYLPKDKDKLSLKFSDSDFTLARDPATDPQKITVPAYEITYNIETDNTLTYSNAQVTFLTQEKTALKVGDLIISTDAGVEQIRRVVAMYSDIDGEVDIAWTTNKNDKEWYFQSFEKRNSQIHLVLLEDTTDFEIQDGGNYSVVAAAKKANFPNSINMPSLVYDYYSTFRNSVYKPIILQAWFNLSVVEFSLLDLMRPVYLSYFGKDYYINKVDQFKQNSVVRIELLSLMNLKRRVPEEVRTYTITPAENVDLGSWTSGDLLPEGSYVVENTGNVQLTIITTLEGVNPNEFVFIAGGGSTILPIGSNYTVTVGYGGVNTGGTRTALLRFNSEFLHEQERQFSIFVQVYSFVFVPSGDLDFGSIPPESNDVKGWDISNTGSMPLSFTLAIVSGDQFVVIDAVLSLGVGESGIMNIRHIGIDEGSIENVFNLVESFLGTYVLHAVANVISDYSYTVVPLGDLHFGDVPPNSGVILGWLVTNIGNVPIDMELNITGDQFTVLDTAATIQPNESYEMRIQHTGFDDGAIENVFNLIEMNSLNGYVFYAYATVTGVYDFEVTPPSIDFGDVSIGVEETRDFTIENTGTVNTTIIIGISFGQYFAIAPPSLTLTPSQTGIATVTYRGLGSGNINDYGLFSNLEGKSVQHEMTANAI